GLSRDWSSDVCSSDLRHARIERERLVLARVVVARAVADLHRALLCGIEHLERWHELACCIRPDAEPSFRERLELVGESLRAAVQDRKSVVQGERDGRG